MRIINFKFLKKKIHFLFRSPAIGWVCLLFCLFNFSCSSDDDTPPAPSSPRLNESDSLAMVNIYKAIGPWGYEWDLENIQTWGGVQIALDLDFNEYRIVGFEYYNGTFSGVFPEDFRKLTELRVLAISGGDLSGEIPEWIGELKHLQYLAIGENCMTGKIPESIGELTDLERLIISSNQIGGKLPESLGNLTKVYRLTIVNTQVEGEIPKSLKNMKSAIVMDLANNRLSGRFPIEILTNKRLAVGCENNFITELPFEVWKDDFVGSPPYLEGNMLSGTIPDWVFETDKWNEYGDISVVKQKEGYGYSNYRYDGYNPNKN